MGDILEPPPPPGIHTAARAMEVARIWIADHKQQVVPSGNLREDPRARRLMLVDLARLVSKAYESQLRGGRVALAQIMHAFDAERRHPTDELEQLS